jgi:hypothetical protein
MLQNPNMNRVNVRCGPEHGFYFDFEIIQGRVSAAKKKDPQTTRIPPGEIFVNAFSQAAIGSMIASAVPDQSSGSIGTKSPGSTNRGFP